MWGGTKYYDWTCYKCGLSNFQKRDNCFRCGASRDKPKDWYCDICGELNFGSRTSCRKCHPEVSTNIKQKPGDWTCDGCGDMNFASRTNCRKCYKSKNSLAFARAPSALAMAPSELRGISIKQKPDDWTCGGCEYVNFASRTNCRKCYKAKNSSEISIKQDDMGK
jgi:hypothetical protein